MRRRLSYFNAGIDSSPAVLFFDGQVRLLPNRETIAADEAVARSLGSADGLWFSPGSLPNAGLLGQNGYFNEFAAESIDVGHTILTIDGILGRDTIAAVR